MTAGPTARPAASDSMYLVQDPIVNRNPDWGTEYVKIELANTCSSTRVGGQTIAAPPIPPCLQ